MHLRLRQIATLCLWDVASNAKNGSGTHSLHLTQIANKTHSVNGPLLYLNKLQKILIEQHKKYKLNV